MSNPDNINRAGTRPSSASVQAFIDALIPLTNDPDGLLGSLAETLSAMRPPGSPTEAEVEYLLTSSAFTPRSSPQSVGGSHVVRPRSTVPKRSSRLFAQHGP